MTEPQTPQQSQQSQQDDSIVIVGDDGTEYEFPAGFDPKRAAAIVRQDRAWETRGQPRYSAGTSEDPAQDQLSGFLHGLNERLGPVARPWEADSSIGVVGNLLQSVVPGVAGPTLAMKSIPATTHAAGRGLVKGGTALERANAPARGLAGAAGRLVRHGVANAAGQALVPGFGGVVLGETAAIAAPPILRGVGRVMQRTGRAMQPASLDDVLNSTMTTIAQPRLVRPGGGAPPVPPPRTLGATGRVPPMPPPASQAARPATIAPGGGTVSLSRPDLVPRGDEAAFNAARPQPVRPSAPSLDELVGRQFDAMEPMRSHAPSGKATSSAVPVPLEPLPPSRSSGARSAIAPELTPRDLEVLGVDPTTGKNPQGMRILKLKGVQPEAKQRILQSRANRHSQYRTDAEILADLRRMQEREP